jgi:di/tricarboxylate transporter
MWIKIFASRPEIGKFMTEIPLALWATVGFILILITKTMSIKEAFESIDLGTIFLFAGMLSMGVALNETGAAKLIAENIVKFTGQSPYGAMIGLIIACMIIGNFMSHTATAALFAPIAIQMSNSMHILPTTFLMAVGLAVSTCIVTPVSTPPNTLAVAPGDYIFKDYFKLGWPIQLMAAIILIVLIPVFIPFTPLIP